MIRYTVVWHDDALNQLADIWMNASNRQSVTSAASTIDRQLADDASTKGTAVEGDLRLTHVPPLRVLFAVIEADRLVRIVDISLS
jgi:hypothetical protein